MRTRRNSRYDLPKGLTERRGRARLTSDVEVQGALTVLIVVLVSLLTSAVHAQEPAAKRVLVLYWYDKNYSWNVGFDQTFQSALQSTHGSPVEYYPEYL